MKWWLHANKEKNKQIRQIAAQEPQADGGSLGPHSSTNSQKQCSSFLLRRTHSKPHVGDTIKYDSRRSSTSTNIVHQLPLQGTLKTSQLKHFKHRDFPQPSCQSSLQSYDVEDSPLSPSYLKPPSSDPDQLHFYHHRTSNSHDNPDENLHHYLLRHNFEGALKKSAEELHVSVARNDEHTTVMHDSAVVLPVVKSEDVVDIKRLPSNEQTTEVFPSSIVTCPKAPVIKINKVETNELDIKTVMDEVSLSSLEEEASWKRILRNIVSTKHVNSESEKSSKISDGDSRRSSTLSHMLHQVTHASRREVKAAKSLSIIVLFFMMCWFPLYTINCVHAFCGPNQCAVPIPVMDITIILTHLNSAINPFLYAYHMKDFRHALKAFILYRILRREMRLDTPFNRNLASIHHSTVYRVSMGGGSPQLANLHTTFTHNTPLTSSPSPVAGTPGCLRSRTSTLGSYGPWLPSRGISPTIFKTPQDQAEVLARPRAATITSHTSPASACSPVRKGSKVLKPIHSETDLSDLAKDHLKESTENQVPTSVDTVIVGVSKADPSSEVVRLSSDNFRVEATEINKLRQTVCTYEDSEPKIISNPGESSVSTDSYFDKMSSPSVNSILDAAENANTTVGHYQCKLHNALSIISQRECSQSDIQQRLDSNSHSCTAKLIGENMIQNAHHPNPRLMRPLYLQLKEENAPGIEKQNNVVQQKVSHISNGTEESAFSHNDSEQNALQFVENYSKINEVQGQGDLDSTNDFKMKEGVDLSTKDYYKYFPRILQRKDVNRGEKGSKTGKSWFSNMLRHRSYHGVSLEAPDSKDIPRAKSLSGSVGT
ncbi:hypothetical protein SK128_021378 [Halocaridina rubra]|uniref:G-protein coupled receptors family 1 profile domain-containing protein n=1 Tax=Halocaridina rubra TaxID=373956 RepID=A0AAN8XFG5_HALRR